MKSIEEIKHELRETLPIGIDLAIQALKTLIPAEVEKYNDVILLESRYRELNQNLLRGLVDNEDAQIEFNKLRENILLFITDLKEGDFTKKSATQAASGPKKGKILYRIPDQMQVQKEVKCIVRVAFNEVILMQDLERISDDSIKDVRIAEVMSAQLVDPNEEKAFNIRTFSEGVQFIDEADFTEWLFYVKPLLQGTYPLLLKICVIEIVDGLERKREVVLEETIQVVATEVAEKADFATASYPIQLTGTHGDSGAAPTAPGTSKKVGASTAATILAGIVLAFLAIWFFRPEAPPPPVPPIPEQNGNGRGKGRKEPVNVEPDRSEIKPVLNDTLALMEYLDSFPDGEHAQEVLDSLASIRFYFDYQQKGDSLIFNVNGGQTPIQLSLLKGNQSVLNRKISTAGRVVISMGKTKMSPGNYNAVLQDSSGIKRERTITIQKLATLPTKKPIRTQPSGGTKTPDKPKIPDQPKTPAVAPPKIEKPVNYTDASQRPLYKGCDQKNKKRAGQCTEQRISEFIRSRLSRMPEATNVRATKLVQAIFVIEKDGSVVVESVRQDFGTGFEKKIEQVVESMPKFTPGKIANGEVVRVRYTLPIRFEPQ